MTIDTLLLTQWLFTPWLLIPHTHPTWQDTSHSSPHLLGSFRQISDHDHIPKILHFYLQIKTLRLATSYISYLTGVLETDDPAGGFRAELGSMGRKSSNNGQIQVNECSAGQISPKTELSVRIVMILIYPLNLTNLIPFR